MIKFIFTAVAAGLLVGCAQPRVFPENAAPSAPPTPEQVIYMKTNGVKSEDVCRNAGRASYDNQGFISGQLVSIATKKRGYITLQACNIYFDQGFIDAEEEALESKKVGFNAHLSDGFGE